MGRGANATNQAMNGRFIMTDQGIINDAMERNVRTT